MSLKTSIASIMAGWLRFFTFRHTFDGPARCTLSAARTPCLQGPSAGRSGDVNHKTKALFRIEDSNARRDDAPEPACVEPVSGNGSRQRQHFSQETVNA